MKLFIKILLSVFIVLIANVNVTSATITFPNIQEATASFSFRNEIPKMVFKVFENDLSNCCQNEQNLVDYRDWGVGVKASAAKGVIGPGLKIADNKLIQHAHQWGIAEKGAALTTEQLGVMRNLTNHIYKNASTIRQGVWGNPAAGGFNNALFYSNGKHIVVTQSDGTMITILRNATGNKHFNNATTIWTR